MAARKRCQVPSCKRVREDWQLLCSQCWAALPEDMKVRFWSTRAHSGDRLDMCREVLRYVRGRQGELEV